MDDNNCPECSCRLSAGACPDCDPEAFSFEPPADYTCEPVRVLTAHATSGGGLAALLDELRELPAWPRVHLDAGLLLGDVLRALGWHEAAITGVIGASDRWDGAALEPVQVAA